MNYKASLALDLRTFIDTLELGQEKKVDKKALRFAKIVQQEQHLDMREIELLRNSGRKLFSGFCGGYYYSYDYDCGYSNRWIYWYSSTLPPGNLEYRATRLTDHAALQGLLRKHS